MVLLIVVCGLINLASWAGGTGSGCYLVAKAFSRDSAYPWGRTLRRAAFVFSLTILDIVSVLAIRFMLGGARSTATGTATAVMGAVISIFFMAVRAGKFDLLGYLRRSAERA